METQVDPADAGINTRLTKEEKIRFLREMVERVRRIGKPVRLPLVSQTPAPLSCGGTHWSAI